MFEWAKGRRREWRRRYREWRMRVSDQHFSNVRSAVVVALAVVVGGGVYFAGKPVWDLWRHRRAMSQALDYAEKQDYRNSMLALKRATELAPLDLATWREVSERLAELGSPQAIVARENVVRLSPGDVAMRLALVTEALRFGQVEVAGEALAGVGEGAREDATFHRLAAAVAMATGQTELLENHLSRLVSAEPGDATARFNLAAIRLWGVDAAKQAEALAELERLLSEPPVRVRAALQLLNHAARVRDANRAREVVNLLLERFNVPATSRLTNDDAPAGWTSLLQALRDTAEFGGGDDVALVAGWLGEVRQGKDALVWIDGLTPALRASPAVMRAEADLSLRLEDYDRLEPLLRAGALGPLSADAARLAVASRIQQVRYQPARGRTTWEDAITACGRSVASLTVLATVADAWRDAEGNERTLQEILRLQPRTNWAYQSLRNSYAARGETLNLWQLYGTWRNVRPDDPELMRPWISLGAVLDRLTPEAGDWIKNRAASAGATSLDQALAAAVFWRAAQMKEAVERLDKIPVADRGRADLAFWRAVILADTDQKDEARAAALQARRPGLLREEIKLLETAAR